MGTKRKPSLVDVGKLFHEEVKSYSGRSLSDWEQISREDKKEFVKFAIKIWQEVEKCI